MENLHDRFIHALTEAGLSESDMQEVISDPISALIMVDVMRESAVQIVSYEEKIILFHKRPLYITKHAINQMKRRWAPRDMAPKRLSGIFNALELLLKDARMETLDERILYNRSVRNGGVKAQYWRAGKWRLVMVPKEGYRVLVTVERPYDGGR